MTKNLEPLELAQIEVARLRVVAAELENKNAVLEREVVTRRFQELLSQLEARVRDAPKQIEVARAHYISMRNAVQQRHELGDGWAYDDETGAIREGD